MEKLVRLAHISENWCWIQANFLLEVMDTSLSK